MTREELLKSAKPILFNTKMVKAILDGRKTVTRRAIKFPEGMTGRLSESGATDHIFYPGGIKYPLYRTGDILYVRETWTTDPHSVDLVAIANGTMPVYYKADYAEKELDNLFGSVWKPSIHMPKEAARIFLKVTDVRVERLQDISTRGIRAEGINECFMCCNENCETKTLDRVLCGNTWIDLWNSTIKKQDLDKYSWEANPWVWVYEFEKIKTEI